MIRNAKIYKKRNKEALLSDDDDVLINVEVRLQYAVIAKRKSSVNSWGSSSRTNVAIGLEHWLCSQWMKVVRHCLKIAWQSWWSDTKRRQVETALRHPLPADGLDCEIHPSKYRRRGRNSGLGKVSWAGKCWDHFSLLARSLLLQYHVLKELAVVELNGFRSYCPTSF